MGRILSIVLLFGSFVAIDLMPGTARADDSGLRTGVVALGAASSAAIGGCGIAAAIGSAVELGRGYSATRRPARGWYHMAIVVGTLNLIAGGVWIGVTHGGDHDSLGVGLGVPHLLIGVADIALGIAGTVRADPRDPRIVPVPEVEPDFQSFAAPPEAALHLRFAGL